MTVKTHPVSTLLWVYVTAPNLPPFWARTSRILYGLSPTDKQQTIRLLRAGNSIIDTKSQLCFQMLPLPKDDKKRLARLERLETDCFRLTTFRLDTAMYTRGNVDYVSMREMIERGYRPSQLTAIDRANTAVTMPGGNLIDVFVPVAKMALNFTKS